MNKIVVTFAIISLTFFSCSMSASAANPQDDEPLTGTVIGRINVNGWKRYNDHSMVSISRFPNNISEFGKLESQVSNTPQGAVTMMIIAISMLRKDEDFGSECIAEIASSAKGTSVSLMRSIAAYEYYPRLFYKGATADNSYAPFSPTRVDVYADKNSYAVNGQLTLYVRAGGEKTNIPVVVRKVGNTYKVTDFSHLALHSPNGHR
ncbi:MAG: hypothetical protein LKK19_05735 [Bacteroidales bacterium]|jgi:hypothetical protein|nr:hypothetical protein [Bacteroidales bacterium]MCI2122186.1 hypothetical protein [Bacteroidales bacterium]MCI2145594.1 hypothetical protein [Bacteroidales bacterium]